MSCYGDSKHILYLNENKDATQVYLYKTCMHTAKVPKLMHFNYIKSYFICIIQLSWVVDSYWSVCIDYFSATGAPTVVPAIISIMVHVADVNNLRVKINWCYQKHIWWSFLKGKVYWAFERVHSGSILYQSVRNFSTMGKSCRRKELMPCGFFFSNITSCIFFPHY